MCPALPALESAPKPDTSPPSPTLAPVENQILHALADLIESMDRMTASNLALVEALIQQGQEEEQLPATTYMSGKRIK
jgi:hypothetical protein